MQMHVEIEALPRNETPWMVRDQIANLRKEMQRQADIRLVALKW